MLLFARFLERWKGLERNGFRARLERALDERPTAKAQERDGIVRCSDSPHSPRPRRSVELDEPSLYFNRELSWLDFNDRVLQLAEDPRSRCSSA